MYQTEIVSVSSYGHVCVCLVIWTCVRQTEIVSVSSYGHVCVRQSRHMDVSVSDWDSVCLFIWT